MLTRNIIKVCRSPMDKDNQLTIKSKNEKDITITCKKQSEIEKWMESL